MTAGTREGFYVRRGKRALDLLLCLLTLPVAGPLILAFALLARLDGGPGFYGQARVGRGGKLFKCWKVRTMVVDADDRLDAYLAANPEAKREWEVAQKLRNDPRITTFGAFLRTTSLDELPQLWNIFVGDMSFVGPRPFTPVQTDIYNGMSYYALRPGLTGSWQVGARNDASFATRAIHDSTYARRVSLWLDLGILLRTARVVLERTGR
ncbi:Sugar transferase involved in LPS biosynthesis (colanic, teichoic acid) [Albimonas pacifica]|uniref:Sugar transferase involved in LPS biosynthesis (Colanic, teichoic acid) n=2 Tax=Albimonas pacifica TaxID=1114924 RepID=A0A1I3F6P5_9RHOB|nr:Sugar transferase involved in LPS biosynthesis (colanic, teichoic acid) [Albimonas pacifica]